MEVCQQTFGSEVVLSDPFLIEAFDEYMTGLMKIAPGVWRFEERFYNIETRVVGAFHQDTVWLEREEGEQTMELTVDSGVFGLFAVRREGLHDYESVIEELPVGGAGIVSEGVVCAADVCSGIFPVFVDDEEDTIRAWRVVLEEEYSE